MIFATLEARNQHFLPIDPIIITILFVDSLEINDKFTDLIKIATISGYLIPNKAFFMMPEHWKKTIGIIHYGHPHIDDHQKKAILIEIVAPNINEAELANYYDLVVNELTLLGTVTEKIKEVLALQEEKKQFETENQKKQKELNEIENQKLQKEANELEAKKQRLEQASALGDLFDEYEKTNDEEEQKQLQSQILSLMSTGRLAMIEEAYQSYISLYKGQSTDEGVKLGKDIINDINQLLQCLTLQKELNINRELVEKIEKEMPALLALKEEISQEIKLKAPNHNGMFNQPNLVLPME